MFKRIGSLFGRKDEAGERNRAELLEYIESMGEEDIGPLTLLAGYWLRFGENKPETAFLRAIQTLTYLRSDDPELRDSAERSVKFATGWAEDLGPEALEIGRECLRSAGVPAPVEAKQVDPQRAYAERFAKYGIGREDMQPLATIAAFAWKYMKWSPAKSVEYAMQTICLSRNGPPKDMAYAKQTWESAIRWSLDTGLDATRWGFEVLTLVREGRA